MNSDVLADIQNFDKKIADREKREMADANVRGKADIAQGFMKHPGWQMFVKDLKEVRENLVKVLINDSALTKEKMNHIRHDIKFIDLVTSQPDKYLQRLQSFYIRKNIK